MDFLKEHQRKLQRGKTLELKDAFKRGKVGVFHEEMIVYSKERMSERTRLSMQT